MALSLCAHWTSEGEAGRALANIKSLLSGAQLEHKIIRLCELGGGSALVATVVHAVSEMASSPGFSAIVKLLSMAVAAALAMAQDALHLLARLGAAAAERIRSCLVAAAQPGLLSFTMQEIDLMRSETLLSYFMLHVQVGICSHACTHMRQTGSTPSICHLPLSPTVMLMTAW
jgi:hypothetical protein